MGKIITSADGKPPTITYNQGSAVPVATSEGASLDMMNRVGIVGLGKVFSSTEVITEGGEGPTALEVVVNHNDWDPRNLQGTFKIYQPGREVQITGKVVDFDMTDHMMVVLLPVATEPSGGFHKQAPLSDRPPSQGKTCKATVKFDSGLKGKAPTETARKATTSPSAFMKVGSPAKLGKVSTEDDKYSSGESAEEYNKEEPVESPPPKKPQRCPRNNILKAAAKRMKRA
ncbi:hypothetical protein PCANC_01877 [Puccinia coronata f. sp. avenae]|uniref:Uncharacterized protein n=1 Tax=Puccinia coronata f. sp. avenae TaxID=200324 RepID=A0A2N5W4A9_9BASI|nr:hypothetical protein PCANC_01877 [Puccinia coronata f. sp. avenae]